MNNKAILAGIFLVYVALQGATTQFPSASDITYLFSHGLADTHKQAYKYTKTDDQQDYLIGETVKTFNYPDATERFFRVNRHETSLAQENEIACLSRAYDEITVESQGENQNIVFFGVSRGASTIINFIGSNNQIKVDAVILESPFDSVESIVENKIKQMRLNWMPGIKKIGYHIMSFIFAKHKREGMRPIDMVSKIQRDIPILIVCSQQDPLVPASSSIRLYRALIQAGHNHTYLLVTKEGRHAKIISDADDTTYKKVVHAFYKKYNLPHDNRYAQQGKNILKERCQPSELQLKKYQ